MRLYSEPFEKIKFGEKKMEIRLNDEKRRRVNVGDIIVFSKLPDFFDKIMVKVVGRTEVDSYPNMDKYYSRERQKKLGFVIFSIKLLK